MKEEYNRLHSSVSPDTIKLKALTVQYDEYEKHAMDQLDFKNDSLMRATRELNEGRSILIQLKIHWQMPICN